MEKASNKNNYHYNKILQPYANELRKRMTKGEACMWKYVLGRRKMKGYQFKRQRPVLHYIADFMCMDLMLIIEIDGITHDDEIAYVKDQIRQKKLEEIGFTVLRFSDWEVLNRIADVAIQIGEWIEKHAINPPPYPRQRGRTAC